MLDQELLDLITPTTVREKKINHETTILDFSQITQDLGFVEDIFNEYPALSIVNLKERLQAKYKKEIDEMTEDEKRYITDYFEKPYLKVLDDLEMALTSTGIAKINFSNIEKFIQDKLSSSTKERIENAFTDEERCKLLKSFLFTSSDSFNDSINGNPACWLFKKIKLSCWHNGFVSADWNFIAECFNKIISFKMDIPDFTVDIDTSTYHNNRGYSRNTRTFLDAELAYIIKYKGEHVLTIGFDTIQDKKYADGNLDIVSSKRNVISIMQIQCKNKKGNRWLYKIPGNYVEYFLNLFKKHFNGFDLELVSTYFLESVILGNYQNEVKVLNERIKQFKGYAPERLQEAEEELVKAQCKLDNFIEDELPRLKNIYEGNLTGLIRTEGTSEYSNKLEFV